MPNKKNLSPKYQPWVDARKRFHLSHAQIQMARELGMNPKKFGSLANHKQESWKAPLPIFIERLYLKQFGKTRPDRVLSIEELVAEKKRKQAERKARKKEAEQNRGIPSVFQECAAPAEASAASEDPTTQSESGGTTDNRRFPQIT